jgi:hypothetical protein
MNPWFDLLGCTVRQVPAFWGWNVYLPGRAVKLFSQEKVSDILSCGGTECRANREDLKNAIW